MIYIIWYYDFDVYVRVHVCVNINDNFYAYKCHSKNY